MGFRIFVVTNQPDISRGVLAPSELDAMSAVVQAALAPDEMVACVHDDEDRCSCRKPAPGMLVDIAKRWRIDLKRSFMVGDSPKDIEAGRRAGCQTIFIRRGGMDAGSANHIAADLGDAVSVIERVAVHSRARTNP
jgi:D-glycero-D-manno-heptose 1,7-bisphosphate phosphatase